MFASDTSVFMSMTLVVALLGALPFPLTVTAPAAICLSHEMQHHVLQHHPIVLLMRRHPDSAQRAAGRAKKA